MQPPWTGSAPTPGPATANSPPPPTLTQPSQASPPQERGRKICPGCHSFNAATSSFCADCGVTLPREASTPTFGGPAGFWIRLVAFVLDGVLLVIVDMILSDRLGLPDPDPERMEFTRFLVESIPAILVSLAVSSVYAMLMVGTWGGTVGKLVLGLRVVRFSDGGRVPYGLALGRSLAELVSMLFVGLGYLWIALTPSKRGWHDYLCDTRVVRARPE